MEILNSYKEIRDQENSFLGQVTWELMNFRKRIADELLAKFENNLGCNEKGMNEDQNKDFERVYDKAVKTCMDIVKKTLNV